MGASRKNNLGVDFGRAAGSTFGRRFRHYGDVDPLNGADMVRVHDVREMANVAKVADDAVAAAGY